MQNVNTANDFLKSIKPSNTGYSADDLSREEARIRKTKQKQDWAYIMLANIHHRFDLKAFENYFSDLLNGVKIYVEVDKTKVKTEIDQWSYNVKYNVNFFTENRKTVFAIRVNMPFSEMENHKGGLTTSDIDLKVGINIEILHNRKK